MNYLVEEQNGDYKKGLERASLPSNTLRTSLRINLLISSRESASLCQENRTDASSARNVLSGLVTMQSRDGGHVATHCRASSWGLADNFMGRGMMKVQFEPEKPEPSPGVKSSCDQPEITSYQLFQNLA